MAPAPQGTWTATRAARGAHRRRSLVTAVGLVVATLLAGCDGGTDRVATTTAGPRADDAASSTSVGGSVAAPSSTAGSAVASTARTSATTVARTSAAATTGAAPTGSTVRPTTTAVGAAADLGRVRSAMRDVAAFHVDMEAVDADGVRNRYGLTFSGVNDVQGTLSFGEADGTVVKLAADLYLKGERALFDKVLNTTRRAKADRIGDRYLHTYADDTDLKALGQLILFLPRFVDLLLACAGPVVRRDGRTIDGQTTVGLGCDAPNAAFGTAYVTDGARPVPLLVEQRSGKATFTATFTDWGTKVEIRAPAADQIFEVTELGG